MASLHEGFGLPAAEAMACETPVVATTAGALPEVVGDDAGILVPPKNPAAIRDAVARLLGDGALRKVMGKKGRKRAERLRLPVAARNTLEVYRT